MANRVNVIAMTLVTAGLCGGCSSWRHLVPADSAQRVSGQPDAATAEVSAVRVSANANAWQGSTTVWQELTPVKLSIQNHSGGAIVVGHLQIALVSPVGKLSALAPDRIAAHTASPRTPAATSMAAGPIVGPQDQITQNQPAPAEKPQADMLQSPRSGELARNAAAPQEAAIQEEVRRVALPEGAIANGQEASGFVYFHRLPDGLDRVDLLVVAQDAAGKPITVRIPFAVKQ